VASVSAEQRARAVPEESTGCLFANTCEAVTLESQKLGWNAVLMQTDLFLSCASTAASPSHPSPGISWPLASQTPQTEPWHDAASATPFLRGTGTKSWHPHWQNQRLRAGVRLLDVLTGCAQLPVRRAV